MILRRLASVSLVAAVGTALAVAGGGSSVPHRSALLGGLPVIPVSMTPASGPSSSVQPPVCVNSSGTFACYSPQLIRQAYDFPSGPSAPTGRGQTIVVVEAFGSPTIEADLAAFDAQWDIPAPPALAIVGPNGSGDPTDSNVQAWQQETSLDVEWAHALAPGARIVLVVSVDDSDDAMNAAEGSALPSYPGAIVSHSFGSAETDDVPGDVELHRILVDATRLGDTLVAGSGDSGATFGTGSAEASYPASDPLVTAVGGTEGDPYPGGLLRRNGTYGGEQTWNEGATYDLASGGAPSAFFPSPPWQQGLTHFKKRTTPDVSFDAALDGGVLVVWRGSTLLMGGTSVGSPSWSAIFALANEARGGNGIGLASPALYAIATTRGHYRADFHDITEGSNKLDSSIGFHADRGYDLATGLGTPDVANLIGDLTGYSAGATTAAAAPTGPSSGRDHDRHPGR